MNNPLKEFCKWSFEQGDRKWQQDELEHGFEQWWDFFWRKTKWMGAGISEGGLRGTHKPGGRAQGGGRALQAWGPLVRPPDVFSVPKILKYSRKNHTKFSRNSENFYF